MSQNESERWKRAGDRGKGKRIKRLKAAKLSAENAIPRRQPGNELWKKVRKTAVKIVYLGLRWM
jgi:hypothetical protein